MGPTGQDTTGTSGPRLLERSTHWWLVTSAWFHILVLVYHCQYQPEPWPAETPVSSSLWQHTDMGNICQDGWNKNISWQNWEIPYPATFLLPPSDISNLIIYELSASIDIVAFLLRVLGKLEFLSMFLTLKYFIFQRLCWTYWVSCKWFEKKVI